VCPHPPGLTCLYAAVEQDCLRDRQPGHRCRRLHPGDRDFLPQVCKLHEACNYLPRCRFYHPDEVDQLHLEPKASLRSIIMKPSSVHHPAPCPPPDSDPHARDYSG
jgi:hypothetical protein